MANDRPDGHSKSRIIEAVVEFNQPVDGKRIWPIRLTANEPALIHFDLYQSYTITGASVIRGSPLVECYLVSHPPSSRSRMGILPADTSTAEYKSQVFHRHRPLKEVRYYVVGMICTKREEDENDQLTTYDWL